MWRHSASQHVIRVSCKQNISNIELSSADSYILCTSYWFPGLANIFTFSYSLRSDLFLYCSSAGTKYSGLVSCENLSSPTRIWFPLKGLNQVKILERGPTFLRLPVGPVSRPKFCIIQQIALTKIVWRSTPRTWRGWKPRQWFYIRTTNLSWTQENNATSKAG